MLRSLFILGFIAFVSTVALGQEKTSDKKLSTRERAAHVLNRLAFGPRPGEVERLAHGGQKAIDAWIASQLKPMSLDDSATDQKLTGLPSLALSPEGLLEHYPRPADLAESMGIDKEKFKSDDDIQKQIREKIGQDHLPEHIVEELQQAKLIRATESKRQLQEVLLDFWFNHFNVDAHKNQSRYLVTSYERDALRPHLFGKFFDLLRATARHPAMMIYLDNSQSQSPLDYRPPKVGKNGQLIEQTPRPRKRGLNENYARELLELHTLGVDGGYTQSDVTELARVLTGWGVSDRKLAPDFEFHENVHDRGEKTVLGHHFPAGHNIEEGEDALLMLARHPATAHHIATELAQMFVSDHPPKALIERVSDVFLKSDGDLSAVYRAIFSSPEFWSRDARLAKIKTPLRLIVSSVRALNGEVDLQSDLPKKLKSMGEELYACQPPTGYKDDAEAWVNPGAMVTRLNISLQITQGQIGGVVTSLPQLPAKPITSRQLLGVASERVLHETPSASTATVALGALGSEGGNLSTGEVRPLQVAKAVGLLLGSPEFQRH